MHNSSIVIEDDLTIALKAGVSEQDELYVNCSAPSQGGGDKGERMIVTPIFSVDLVEKPKYLYLELLDSPQWDFDLEIAVSGKLAVLR
jgi:hypothetical protein